MIKGDQVIGYRKISIFILLVLVGSFMIGCGTSELNTREKEEIAQKLRKTAFKEVSFESLMTQSKFQMEDIYIEDFSISVNNEGYIQNLNIIFAQLETTKEFILMYRRESRLFKIIEQNQELASSQVSNSSIMKIIDEQLVPLISIDKTHDAIIIDLMAPMPISLSMDSGHTYYNGILIDNALEEKIEGITFYSYKKPIEENDELINYIFSSQ